ncbi:MAG TPA: hypothetical protein VFV43_05755 [Limnobacter sp.]|nr:hypothetical protein [Limnobacter sp.]
MATIRDLIKDNDDVRNLTEDARKHLDALMALAETKGELFRERITTSIMNAGVGSDKTIPITQILDSSMEVRAYRKQSGDKLKESIKSSVSNFVAGGKENIINGVTGLLSTAIDALFGSSEAGGVEFQKYYVLTEGLSIIRLDVWGWAQKIEATSLTSIAEQISVFTYYKSAVDVRHLDFNAFLSLYQNVMLHEDAAMSSKDIEKELDEVGEVFDLFKKHEVAGIS